MPFGNCTVPLRFVAGSFLFCAVIVSLGAQGEIREESDSAWKLRVSDLLYYNSSRIPGFPGNTEGIFFAIPLGIELSAYNSNVGLISGAAGRFTVELFAGLEVQRYYLTPGLVGRANPEQIPGTPIDPDSRGTEYFTSLPKFEENPAIRADSAKKYVGEFDQFRSGFAVGFHQQIPLKTFQRSPLSIFSFYDLVFAFNIMDEEMLGPNSALEKNQLIFLSREPDRRQYLVNKFQIGVQWNSLENPNKTWDHGVRKGFKASATGEIAPGFLNPSIDQGHSSEGSYFDPEGGINASFYRLSAGVNFAHPLFDCAPEQENNLFSAYIGAALGVNWFDKTGEQGRIPLEIRMSDSSWNQAYRRRFRFSGSIGFYSRLPERPPITSYWITRVRARFDHEMGINDAFSQYVRRNGNWVLSGNNLSGEFRLRFESIVLLRFYELFNLGAAVIMESEDLLSDIDYYGEGMRIFAFFIFP